MAHIAGHTEAIISQEPTLKIQPTEKQMEDALGSSTKIETSVYDYPNTKAISFKGLLEKEIGNLDFESNLFWSEQNTQDYEKYKGVFNSTKPIGYDNSLGGKPIFINEAFPNASDAEKLTWIYNTVTYDRDTISDKKDLEAVRSYRDDLGKSWSSTADGRTFLVDWSKEEEGGLVKNIFGFFLPFVDSNKEAKNRKRVEQELAELGLTPDKADDLREQLKESHWYVALYTDKKKGWEKGKISYHEETKDLSYLIPDVNDYSFKFQTAQILGNMVDDFPSMLASGYAFLSKEYQTGDMAPDKNLLDPERNTNIFGMDVRNLKEGKLGELFLSDADKLKSTEEIREDVLTYANQKEIELDFVEELTSHFDEKKQTQLLWAPFKNLHKNIVYNNTSFELTGKMVEQFENPTDSFLYHATDIIAEGLPYIAAIEGVALAYGIRGTLIYNDAVDYTLANTGQGLRHSNPIMALNWFLKKHVTDSKLKKNPSKFVKKTMQRLDERQAATFGIKTLKVNLQKEIDKVGIQIEAALAKGDTITAKLLKTGQQTLIKNQLDLTPRYWGLTKGQRSLFRNEIFASIFGGVGRDIFGDGLAAAGLEISGAFAEPFMFTHGAKGFAKQAALWTAQGLDFISVVPGSKSARDYLLGKSLELKPADILITDATTGLQRPLNTSETVAINKFINIIKEMPVDQRAEILASMNTADEALTVLMKDLPEDQKELVKFSLSQYTGLAALQAVAEMYNIEKLSTVFTSGDLVRINNEMAESQNLITIVSNSMATLLEKNPNNPQVQNFADKILENVRLIDDDVTAKAQEFEAALEAMVDLEKGLNLFDNPDALDKNIKSMLEMLEDIQKNGFSESVQQTANNLLQNFDKKILDDMEAIANSLSHDGENYKVNGFASIIAGFKMSDKLAYKNAYRALYETDVNFRLDFTEYFEDMMGGLFPKGRFGKLKEPTGILANRLPSTSETKKFIDVINTAVDRNMVDYLKNNSNRQNIFGAFDSIKLRGEQYDTGFTSARNEQMIDFYERVDRILGGAEGRNLSDTEAQQILESFKVVLKDNNTLYKEIPANSITSIDIRDIFLGFSDTKKLNIQIPIKMNLHEAMEFKSGIGAFAFTAAEVKNIPKSRTFMDMHNEIEGVLFDSLNKSGNNDLIENYSVAINAFRSYINKYSNTRFKDLQNWTTTKDNGTLLTVNQNKKGDSTKKLEKFTATDEYATNTYKEITGDDKTKLTQFMYATNPSEWIDYGKLLHDKKYADNFMKNVVAPLVGVRDPSRIIAGAGDDIPYVIDLTNPETVQRLRIIRGFLQEGLGNHFRRTQQGKLILGDNATKKILAEDKINNIGLTTKTDGLTKIKIDDDANSWFKLTGTDGKEINILNINNLINTNLSFDMLLARNKFIGELTLKNNRSFSKIFKNAKKETQRQLSEYKYNKTQLGGTAILKSFGTDLTDSKTFVETILIGRGDLSQYNKLKEVIVGTGEGKISLEEFDTLTKELFAEYFFRNFSIPAQGKDKIITSAISGKPVKEMKIYDSFFENVLGAKSFMQQNNKNLVDVFGKKHVDNIDAILNVVMLKSGVKTSDINKAKLPQSLSVESLISRLYSINRGIISPKYVATEVGLQRFRKSKANLMRELIKSPELAEVVRKVLESDDIYKDAFSNKVLGDLLNESVIGAILLREAAGFIEEGSDERQETMLNEMNQELYNIKDRL